MGGQPVGGDPITLCSPSARKNKRLDVYLSPAVYDRMARIAAEYQVSVQRVLVLAATLCDERSLRDVLSCQD